jgi:mono/diheme cytochrome c family protein
MFQPISARSLLLAPAAAMLGVGALITSLSAAAATDIDAHALVQQNCTSCHGSEVYTRADRKIQSLGALETQVEACNTNLDKGMFPDEVNAVANLLNQEYYKFSD